MVRLSENAHLPFDVLTALRYAEGLRYPHPSSLRRTSMYASFLGISSRSSACGMDIFHQPVEAGFSTVSIYRWPIDSQQAVVQIDFVRYQFSTYKVDGTFYEMPGGRPSSFHGVTEWGTPWLPICKIGRTGRGEARAPVPLKSGVRNSLI